MHLYVRGNFMVRMKISVLHDQFINYYDVPKVITFSSSLIYTQNNKYSFIKVQCHIFYSRFSVTIYLCGVLNTYNNHLACLILWYVGSFLTLLCSEVIIGEQPEVPEFIKTPTEPIRSLFPRFPFSRRIP